jgi:hypothetical protein
MFTSAASGPKNKTRSKAATALNSRLTRYLSISVGAWSLGSQESFADIVIINLGSGSGGFNIDGLNGGLTSGTRASKYNFPTTGPRLRLYNNFNNSGTVTTGIAGAAGATALQFACYGSRTFADIKKLTSSDTINSSGVWSNAYWQNAFKNGSYTASNFSSSDYVAFRFGAGSNWNYGWLQTTWDGTNFQINSGAYQSTLNTAIQAGAVAVPEPGTLALGSLALLAGGGAAVRRYRKQRGQQPANPVTEPATKGSEAKPVA